MSELLDFLKARLNEEEQAAASATSGPWRHDPGKHWRKPGTSWFEEAVFAGPPGSEATCIAGTGATDDPQSMADARYIAAHDPARVLREIGAKRRIIDDLEAAEFTLSTAVNTLRRMVKYLALPYADQPGYKEEWRP